MYTEAKKGKDEFIIQGFNTVWPSKLFTEVTLEAQKSYSSTASSGGKLVFNIHKEPRAIDNVEKTATTDAPGDSDAGELVDYMGPGVSADTLDAETDKKRLTGPGAKASRQTQAPRMTKDVLGRGVRKR